MKYTTAMTAAVLACGTMTAGMRLPGVEMTRVEIWYHFEANASPDFTVMMQAQLQASKLLAEAGVTLEWHRGRPEEGQLGARVIGMTFVSTAPENFSTGELRNALAAARPYGTGATIMVFQDRIVRYLSPIFGPDRNKVLGHVLAHEIVHVLEGVARHSDAGLMKGNWTWRELRDIVRTGLSMSEEDRRLIAMRFERDAMAATPLVAANAAR